MKKFCIIIIMLSVFSVNSAFALDLSKLCGDFSFMDTDTKVYRGSYKVNDVVLLHDLVLVEVSSSNKAFVLYAHGAQPDWDIDKPRCYPRFGTMKGRKLTLHMPYGKVEYKFDKSGGAKVKYISPRKDGSKRITRGSLKLVEH